MPDTVEQAAVHDLKMQLHPAVLGGAHIRVRLVLLPYGLIAYLHYYNNYTSLTHYPRYSILSGLAITSSACLITM